MNFSFDSLTDNRYYSRPMDPLPQYIDPIRFASKSKRLSGQIGLGEMKRLSSLLAVAEGQTLNQIDVDLEFSVDSSKIKNIRGRIRANVKLVCQRCLQAMDYKIDSKVMLGIIIKREQAEQLPVKYEPLLVESDQVLLKDIIEDEMILAVPNTPLHDISLGKEAIGIEVCNSILLENAIKNVSDGTVGSSRDDKSSNKRENPFAVLEKLKRKD